MVYKIIWSPRALEDLREIIQYIRRDKPDVARRFGEKLIAKAESLETFPERGGLIKKFANPNLRQIYLGPYRIAYRIRKEASLVEIARIWHAAQSEESFEL